MRTIVCTALALPAFAGNSVLCRLALGGNAIDAMSAMSFTSLRLMSGIVVLTILISFLQRRKKTASKGSWLASFCLFVYAISFSFAYILLDTSTGALILFGCVQITMILVSFCSAEKLRWVEWLGTLLTFFGFVYMLSPGIDTPSLKGFVLMSLAGVSWAVYTFAGKKSNNPLSDTTLTGLVNRKYCTKHANACANSSRPLIAISLRRDGVTTFFQLPLARSQS